jgi:hypothetical protein
MRLEMDALKQSIEQIDITVSLAETLVQRLPKTASALVDAASQLAPANVTAVLKGCGLTQDLIELICKSAIGMMGLSMDLLVLLAEAPAARKVIYCQLQTYHSALSALKNGHEKQLREAAEQARTNPQDAPKWKSDNALARYLQWWSQR